MIVLILPDRYFLVVYFLFFFLRAHKGDDNRLVLRAITSRLRSLYSDQYCEKRNSRVAGVDFVFTLRACDDSRFRDILYCDVYYI